MTGPQPPADRLPNLVLAGVTKCGTTSLYAYLAQHPQVFAPRTKEINHFSPLVHDRATAPLAEYAAHYAEAGAETWRLDASPFYFVGGQRIASALAETLERPRVLIALRDPVARLWSSYTYKKSKGYVERATSFTAWFDGCVAQYRSGADLAYDNRDALTLRTGRYADFLPAWQETFGADLHVLFAEQLGSDPQDVLSTLFGWLGVDDVSAELDLGRRNATSGSRSVALRRVSYRVNQRLKPALAGRPRLERALHAGYQRLNSAANTETLADADRARVREFYADSTARLGEALRGTHQPSELPGWIC